MHCLLLMVACTASQELAPWSGAGHAKLSTATVQRCADAYSLRKPAVAAATVGRAVAHRSAWLLHRLRLLSCCCAFNIEIAFATFATFISSACKQGSDNSLPAQQLTLCCSACPCLQDYMSYVYVSSFSSGGFSCRGCGLFLQFQGSNGPSEAADDTLQGTNYLLGVSNASFVPALLKYATIDTVRPLFVLLSSNISWGQHPSMQQQQGGSAPAAALAVGRPLVLAGQQGAATSLDLGMGVNKVSLAGQHANLTFDGLVIENLAYGDRQSGNQLSGLSLINTFNIWFFYWDRCVFKRIWGGFRVQSVNFC